MTAPRERDRTAANYVLAATLLIATYTVPSEWRWPHKPPRHVRDAYLITRDRAQAMLDATGQCPTVADLERIQDVGRPFEIECKDGRANVVTPQISR